MKVKNYTILMMIGMNDIELMVIPDVHGRFFWKEPVKYVLENTNIPIVFLGDYLDPYYDDFFDEKDEPLIPNIRTMDDVNLLTIKNFREILFLKKEYKDRIVLLLGNHDCTYMFGEYMCKVRMDRRNYREISTLFRENKNLFQLAHEMYINGKHFIFSHAGINKKYAFQCFGDDVNEDNVVALFNDAYRNENYGVIDSLSMYSRYRGKWGGDYGSLIWADGLEWFTDINENESYGFSVVGHTKFKKYTVVDNFAFLDTKECFIIDKEGDIKKIEEII